MSLINVSIMNASSVLADSDIQPVVDALQKQVDNDFGPAWGVDARLKFVPQGDRLRPVACEPGSYCHLPHSAAQPRHSSAMILPSLNLHRARVRRTGGFLQVVVSKARQHTVLVEPPCPIALPIQP